MPQPRVLVLHANGINRDREAALAFTVAGALPQVVHVNQLRERPGLLDDYQMLVLPGGFSYGDDLGAGKVWALDLQVRFRDALAEFHAHRKPIIGICNGFQALVKSGLLPGGTDPVGKPSVTLTRNLSGRFECRWIVLQPNPSSPCVFTRGLTEPITCPVAHGEGRLVAQDDATLHGLEAGGLVALTFRLPDGAPAEGAYPANPNGSVADIAGLCDPTGTVFGLMPHPEDHIFAVQGPRVARNEAGMLGLPLFQNGVRYAAQC